MLVSSHANHVIPQQIDYASRVGSTPVKHDPERRDGSAAETQKSAAPPNKRAVSSEQVQFGISEQEQKQLQALRNRDREVRAHEQAHASVAGSLAKGGPIFEYQHGPDGRQYAVGGEVQIDTSAEAGDPKATIIKAQQIRRAALAPAQPSSQDQAVAAQASKMEATARAELASQKTQDPEARNTDSGSTETDSLSAAPENAATENKVDLHAKCAVCGGQHSAESHIDNVERKLLETFITAEQDATAEKLLHLVA